MTVFWCMEEFFLLSLAPKGETVDTYEVRNWNQNSAPRVNVCYRTMFNLIHLPHASYYTDLAPNDISCSRIWKNGSLRKFHFKYGSRVLLRQMCRYCSCLLYTSFNYFFKLLWFEFNNEINIYYKLNIKN